MIKPLLFLVSLSLLSLNSGADLRQRTAACFFPDAASHRAPAWVCRPGPSRGLLSEVGYARPSGAGFSFNRQMAIADARVKLARRLQGQCGRRGESDAILRYSRILNLQRSPSGGYYARVGLRASDLRRGC